MRGRLRQHGARPGLPALRGQGAYPIVLTVLAEVPNPFPDVGEDVPHTVLEGMNVETLFICL